MRPLNESDPKQFMADFITSFNEDLAHGDDDPAVVVDRYYTPDVVQIADGHAMNRDQLVEHARPVRKNKPTSRVEVHEAIADGDRIAARYTLFVNVRAKNLVFEFGYFARFSADGRVQQAHMFARDVPSDDTTEALA